MNLSGILRSIEQDVISERNNENGGLDFSDIAQSLDGDVEHPDQEDVEMQDANANANTNVNNALYSSFDSLSLRHRKHTPVEEPNDVEMMDAPLVNDNHARGHRGQEQKPEKEPVIGEKEKEQTQESEPEPEEPQFTLNPTTLGAKVGSALVPYEHSSENQNEAVGKEDESADGPTSGTGASQVQAVNNTGDDKQPYYLMPMPTPSWIAQHQHNRAYIVSTYLQMLFNCVVAMIGLYVISSGLLTFWRDVDYKLEAYSNDLLTEIQTCTRKYLENDCRVDLRPPALEEACERWEKCMNRDFTTSIGRTRVTAETIAEIINSFVEPFSYKTILVSSATVIAAVFVFNFAFGFWRARAYYQKAVQ